MPLGRDRENDFPRRRLALKLHFCILGSSNYLFYRSQKRSFSASVKMINELGADEKVCFRVSEDFVKSILALLPSPKCDSAEVQKALLKVTIHQLNLSFYFLNNRKLDLREVQKDVSRVRLALFIHILPSKHPKYDLGEVGKAMIRVDRRNSNVFFASWEHINGTFLTSRKGIFEKVITQGVA
jgi:hypothetical protein